MAGAAGLKRARPRRATPPPVGGGGPLAAFHPAVAAWFRDTFPGGPTPAQLGAWPAIAAGRHTLVAAPTGTGKTLTAFLTAIDALVRRGLSPDGLPDETVVVYVSPLKALSNDIRLNLERPLAGIREALARLGLADVEMRTAVRTGDTTGRARQQALKRPPHLLVTTPESLYVLLGSTSGRRLLRTARTVIVDEIHAVAASKRGSHLALSLERLAALAEDHHGHALTRIGLSATQKPIATVARFLVGPGRDCAIVDIGYARTRDLAIVVPPTPLGAVMSTDQWEQVYQQLAERIAAHRTTLVFVNTRRMAERAARHLADRLGRDAVAAHHGSLAKEARLDAEQRLKRGALRVLVATASLELGLDIGDVDLVCQIGSPRSIATFLQRAGRSGHAVGGVPKARLFPQSQDELVECAALLDCVSRGELDALRIPQAPLDVLAQQIIAEVAARGAEAGPGPAPGVASDREPGAAGVTPGVAPGDGEPAVAGGASGDGEPAATGVGEDALHDLVRRAMPFEHLERRDFDAIVRMLAEGFDTRHGSRTGLLHRDAVNRRLRARRGSRLTALTSGGTIPETGDYSVLLEPESQTIGTVNEDFAVESLAGDVFQLGNASYRILRIEPGRVRVADAAGAAPNIPFWLGEAPGRSDELSAGVSRLRSRIVERIDAAGTAAAVAELEATLGLDAGAASQLADYLGRGRAALGALPTHDRLVLERFFDESGGMQLVIHAPFGSRVNRAWGLALRKRFCRRFNFELQAVATEDAIVLSLSTSHSFALDEVARYLHSSSALAVLVQALLDAPLFGARWRWNATNALALPRFAGGRKVAPQLQRMRAEDLLAGVFPDQVACAENLTGDRELPDHPLVAQTLRDCLTDAMDADGWLALLRRIETGEVAVVARDLAAPSPFAAEAVNARPYAFLDDAPLEERRTQAVRNRRHADPDSPDDLGRLDPAAIAAVRDEARPRPRDLEEMHEALAGSGMATADDLADPPGSRDRATWLAALAEAGRATRVDRFWVATERLPLIRALLPDAPARPEPVVPAEYAAVAWSREAALLELVRARLSTLGPTTVAGLADPLGLGHAEVDRALQALRLEGHVMAGRFSPEAAAGGAPVEWCERHLLARIHRYTLGRLRREIEPVAPAEFQRFLFEWQHLAPGARVAGPDALAAVLARLEGFEAPAAAWEAELLAARVDDYASGWLDELCTSGRIVWARLRGASGDAAAGGGSPRQTPLLLLPRRHAAQWSRLAPLPDDTALPGRTRRLVDYLAAHGASYFDDIADGTRLLRSELEAALGDAVMRGRVHGDSFFGLRSLLVPPSRRVASAARRRRGSNWSGIQDAGRWSLVRRPDAGGAAAAADEDRENSHADAIRDGEAAIEHVARTLLRRYGIVCWRLMEREAPWLPPWRRLVRVYQRLEARGEIRGGRFIAGLSGEQFALPEAVTALRQGRRGERPTQWVAVAATDPANLVGTIVPGQRLPRVTGTRIVYRDGVPLAARTGDRIDTLGPAADGELAQAVRLLREPAVAALRIDAVMP